MLVPRKDSSGSVLPRYQDTDDKVPKALQSCTAASSSFRFLVGADWSCLVA
jgi:hypothetical protein